MPEIATSVSEVTAVDEPLLSPTPATVAAPSAGGDRTSSRVPMLLGLFAGRSGASLIVSQNVALQLENYREDWLYSFPVVVIETLWNLALVAVSLATLFWIAREETHEKLSVWICGYAFLCAVNVKLLLLKYIRRNETISSSHNLTTSGSSFNDDGSSFDDDGSSSNDDDSSSNDDDSSFDDDRDILHSCELLYRVTYCMWWAFGFSWMLDSYNHHGSPCLFWLTLAFLAMDVFFLALRIIYFIVPAAAFCFCLPCIIAFMYYTSCQENASEAKVNSLPEYRFEVSNGDVEQPDVRACRMIPMETNGQGYSTERVVLTEHSDCCICLCHYEDGEQLLLLPCNHHFHSTCIVKWLRLNATCPVCKSRTK